MSEVLLGRLLLVAAVLLVIALVRFAGPAGEARPMCRPGACPGGRRESPLLRAPRQDPE